MDDCERKYLGDQVRTLQMKCDLLSQQSEQHQQLILQLRISKKAREDIEGKCMVSICQVFYVCNPILSYGMISCTLLCHLIL